MVSKSFLAQSFGLRLQFLRKMRGLTQIDLAQAVDLGIKQIGRIERGEASPSMYVLEKLAQALKTTPFNLFLDPKNYRTGFEALGAIPPGSYSAKNNQADFLRRYQCKTDMAEEVLHLFVKTLPEKLKVLRDHLRSRAWQDMNFVAHSLKGTALNSSCPALASAALALEQAVKTEDFELIESHVDEIHRRISELITFEAGL